MVLPAEVALGGKVSGPDSSLPEMLVPDSYQKLSGGSLPEPAQVEPVSGPGALGPQACSLCGAWGMEAGSSIVHWPSSQLMAQGRACQGPPLARSPPALTNFGGKDIKRQNGKRAQRLASFSAQLGADTPLSPILGSFFFAGMGGAA